MKQQPQQLSRIAIHIQYIRMAMEQLLTRSLSVQLTTVFPEMSDLEDFRAKWIRTGTQKGWCTISN